MLSITAAYRYGGRLGPPGPTHFLGAAAPWAQADPVNDSSIRIRYLSLMEKWLSGLKRLRLDRRYTEKFVSRVQIPSFSAITRALE